jgi:hypothetical protein
MGIRPVAGPELKGTSVMSDTKRTPENHARQYARMRQEAIRELEGKREHEDTVDPVDELAENPRDATRMGRHEAGGPDAEYDEPEERDGEAAQADRDGHREAVRRNRRKTD